jgi:hypothetical protein
MKRVFEKLAFISAAFSLTFFLNPKPVMADHCGFGDITCSHKGCNVLDVTCNPHVKPITKPLSEDAWGEAGSSAYKVAAATMRGRHGSSVGLDEFQKRYLRPHFGNLVDRVAIIYNARMMDQWSAFGKNINLSGVNTAAQTYCNRIYIRDSYKPNNTEQLVTLSHEMTHTKQCESLGGDGKFGFHYFREYKRAGQSYENNKLEQEAYSFENQFTSWLQNQSAPVATSQTGDFIKNGNNGTVSCNAFCGAVNGNKVVWGSEYGVCSSAKNDSTGQLLSCDAVPGLIPNGKQLTCGYNKTAFVKHGNNGTVSCNAFCAGSNWRGGVGRCVAAVNTKNGQVTSCDTATGFLNGPELTCTCGR